MQFTTHLLHILCWKYSDECLIDKNLPHISLRSPLAEMLFIVFFYDVSMQCTLIIVHLFSSFIFEGETRM